ncbi:MAG: hypothetical protein LQ345_005324 [Seirophora villosa]|nr:MAG: hypothetical protein LQ345_005324 [Seirophora villosa]
MPRPESHQQDQVVGAIPDAFSDNQLWILAALRVIENVSFEKIARTLQISNLIMSNGRCCCPKAGRFTAESVISKYMEMRSASRTNKNSNQEEPLSDHIQKEAVGEAKAEDGSEAEEIKLLTKHRNRSKDFYSRQTTHHEDDSSADDDDGDDDDHHNSSSDTKPPDPDYLNKLHAIYQYCRRWKIPNYVFPPEYIEWAFNVAYAQLVHKVVELITSVAGTNFPPPTVVPKVSLPAL